MAAIYRGMDQDELERQYNARGTVPDVDIYLHRYAQLSEAARRECRVFTDLAYGDHPDETYDLFPAGQNTPLLIFIHGGYWRALSKDESGFMAKCFVDAGISVAAINYSLAPGANLDQIVDQVRRCVAHLWSEAEDLGIAQDRIILCGTSTSAGGHLAAMVLNSDWALKQEVQSAGACLISGLFDLEPVRLCLPNTWLKLDIDAARRNSPIRQVAVCDFPVLIVWAGTDTNEFKRQSQDYALALKTRSQQVKTLEIADRNHFDIVLDLADPCRELTLETMRLLDRS